MSMLGDTSGFADFFPAGLVPQILELVISCWNNFSKPQSSDYEVEITRRFRESLRKEKNLHQLPFQIWPESTETDPFTGKEIGRIDLRFIHGYREEVYFAFECKRLRIPGSPNVKNNTSEYVGTNGMQRFVTGKYAKELNAGGMIGYVMDGRVDEIVGVISSRIASHKDQLKLVSRNGLVPSSFLPAYSNVKETRHALAQEFVLHHVFLAV